jgi:hypothetical protein
LVSIRLAQNEKQTNGNHTLTVTLQGSVIFLATTVTHMIFVLSHYFAVRIRVDLYVFYKKYEEANCRRFQQDPRFQKIRKSLINLNRTK